MRDIVSGKFVAGFNLVCGVGINDGKYPREGSTTYNVWAGMITRCYNASVLKRKPSYEMCKVSNNFLNYTYFHEWCLKQVGYDKENYRLDKDLLSGKLDKIYSEDTCCFVPVEINNAIVKPYQRKNNRPLGVGFCKRTNKFKVEVSVNGKTKFIGRYSCQHEAFLAYKQAKEIHLKSLANKYKDQVDPRVYEALMNYQVEITD